MSSFYVKSVVTNGYIPNTGKPNILFKAGDIVSGNVITRYIFNRNMQGIETKPTVAGAYVENPDGLVFIPLENLDNVTNRGIVPPKINQELKIPAWYEGLLKPAVMTEKDYEIMRENSKNPYFQQPLTAITNPNDTRFKTPTQGKPVPEKKPIGLVLGMVVVLGVLYYMYGGNKS